MKNPQRKYLVNHIRTAEQLAKEHGTLPHPYALVTHGYRSLYEAMRKNPEAFTHITQDHKRRALSENVALAEQLAKAHGSKKGRTVSEHAHTAEQLAKKHGKLPGPGWLVMHGYRGLYQAMWKHPEAFAHVPQNKKVKTLEVGQKTFEDLRQVIGRTTRTLEEWALEAEELATAHGRLPIPG